MKSTHTLVAIAVATLMSPAAWADFEVFRGNGDTMDHILLDPTPTSSAREKGEGDFYGTSLEAWGGGAPLGMGMVDHSNGNVDEYGSVILNVRPDLIRGPYAK